MIDIVDVEMGENQLTHLRSLAKSLKSFGSKQAAQAVRRYSVKYKKLLDRAKAKEAKEAKLAKRRLKAFLAKHSLAAP